MRRLLYFIIFGVPVLALFWFFRGDIRDDFRERQKHAQLPPETMKEEIFQVATREERQTQQVENQQGQQQHQKAPKEKRDEINLAMHFSSQAPHANWDLPYQEACEEASALLVHHYWQDTTFTADSIDKEILDLVDWEIERFGAYEHTTAKQTAEILREYFNYEDVRVVYDITIEDIKHETVAGRPVIVPFAGQHLGNPYFTPPGPIYHMSVVKGFTKNGKIIVHDVGTKRGADYLYDPEVVLNAIHDWHDTDITQGRRAMIVVHPNGDTSDIEEGQE